MLALGMIGIVGVAFPDASAQLARDLTGGAVMNEHAAVAVWATRVENA
jgi:hypothetical protein